MMSMPFITTWTFKEEELFSYVHPFCEEEGTVFLFSADRVGFSYLALFPDEKIEAHSWEALQEQIGDDLYFGYLSYEMGCLSDPQKIISHSYTAPLALFYRPTVVIYFDHQTKRATLVGRNNIQPKRRKLWFSATRIGVSETLDSYLEKVRFIQERIFEGEVYQVNFSQEFLFEKKGSAFALFEGCCKSNPFTAYVQTDRFSLVSASPEMFLHQEGDWIQTAPIKGTAPRGKTALEDRQHLNGLLASEKDRAELMMIVDLLRNDFSRICSSVEVESLCELKTFPDVFHLVARIRGCLKEKRDPISIIRHLFPGGSISGCPKLSAMDFIHRLENTPRGPYTGIIGYIEGSQKMHFNIAIRTACIENDIIRLRLGGGIVADSDPVQEYEETLHKGRSFFQCLSSF